MKNLFVKLSAILFLLVGISCNTVNGKVENKEAQLTNVEKIEVYYFHYSRRCATCMAVENETKAALESLYADDMKSEVIVFKAVNLDEPESEAIAQKLEISGQTLLIVAGDKKENLTTDAFMNAKSNPDKLKEIIKSTIDPLLGAE